MRWPWQPKTEDRNYSDAITEAILNASADAAAQGYLSALEIAAGQLSRAFASALPSGPGAPDFPASVRAWAGRSLVELGEAVFYRSDGLIPVVNYTLEGGIYLVTLPDSRQIRAPVDRVVAARWNVDLTTRRGISPLAAARTLKMMLQRIENSITQETSAAVGYLLPVPSDGDSANIAELKKDLATLAGKIAVVETTRGGWGTSAPSAAPRQDYRLERLGPNVPDSSVALYLQAQRFALAACGFPVQLIEQADGTSQREAWRRYLHGTVTPLAAILEEAAARAALPVTFSFDSLFASDISGRARAFQSLVGGGMPIEQAAALSGLLSQDEE